MDADKFASFFGNVPVFKVSIHSLTPFPPYVLLSLYTCTSLLMYLTPPSLPLMLLTPYLSFPPSLSYHFRCLLSFPLLITPSYIPSFLLPSLNLSYMYVTPSFPSSLVPFLATSFFPLFPPPHPLFCHVLLPLSLLASSPGSPPHGFIASDGLCYRVQRSSLAIITSMHRGDPGGNMLHVYLPLTLISTFPPHLQIPLLRGSKVITCNNYCMCISLLHSSLHFLCTVRYLCYGVQRSSLALMLSPSHTHLYISSAPSDTRTHIPSRHPVQSQCV